jgi:hypothetical protein
MNTCFTSGFTSRGSPLAYNPVCRLPPVFGRDFLLRIEIGVLWGLRSEPPRKLSYFVKHFVGSYSIAGVLVMLLGAIA